jgi:hypothetical protein
MITDSIKIKRTFPLIDNNYLINIYWFNIDTKSLYTVSPGNITAPSGFIVVFSCEGCEEPYSLVIIIRATELARVRPRIPSSVFKQEV